jgi:FkbM family methyltransferase
MISEPLHLRAGGKHCIIDGGALKESIATYNEVVLKDVYGIFAYAKKYKPSVIVDIGAYVGIFSRLCSLLFPEAEIYAYEPNPNILSLLTENAKETNIRVFPYAILDKAGTIKLKLVRDKQIFAKVASEGSLFAEAIPISEVCKGQTVDLLKMDCEGSEWRILTNTEFLGRVRTLRMEYHLEGHSIDDLVALLEKGEHRVVYRTRAPKNIGILWSEKIR